MADMPIISGVPGVPAGVLAAFDVIDFLDDHEKEIENGLAALGFPDEVIDAVTDAIGSIDEVMDDIEQGLEDLGDALWGRTRDVLEEMGVPPEALDAVEDFFDGVGDAIGDLFGYVGEFFGDLWDEIVGFFEELLGLKESASQ